MSSSNLIKTTIKETLSFLNDKINDKANDSSVVKLSGDQFIDGDKTFNGSLFATTPSDSENSDRVATTEFVNNCVNTEVSSAISSHTHNKLVLADGNVQSTNTSAYALGALNVRWFTEMDKFPGQPSQNGFLVTLATGDNAQENHQIFAVQSDGNLYHRGTNSSSYASPPAFKTLLDSSNYTTWVVPNTGGTFSGEVKASSFRTTSDIRKKENLKEIKNIDLSSLNTYSYNFKDDKDHRKVGLIAQEVEKICPEAVTIDEDGFKSLDYNAVIALLVAKVNELEKKYGK